MKINEEAKIALQNITNKYFLIRKKTTVVFWISYAIWEEIYYDQCMIIIHISIKL